MPGDHLKHRCLDLPKVEFWLGLSRGRILLLSSIWRLESSFVHLKNVAFSVGQEAENDFNGPFDNYNHRSFDFMQISFWVSQGAENVYAVPCNHYKSRFIEFTKVVFWAVPEAENWLKLV